MAATIADLAGAQPLAGNPLVYNIPGNSGYAPTPGLMPGIITSRPAPSLYSSASILPIVAGTGSVSIHVYTGSKQVAMHACGDPNGNQTGLEQGADEFAVVGLSEWVGIYVDSITGTVTQLGFVVTFFNGARQASAGDTGTVNQGAKGSSPWLVEETTSGGTAIWPTPAAIGDAIALPTATEIAAVLQVQTADTLDVLRRGKLLKGASLSASGNTAIHTPASGKKARILRGLVQIGGDAYLSAAGVETISIKDSGTAIPGLTWNVYLPDAPINGAYPPIPFELDQGYLSAAANNVINGSLSAALASGTVQIALVDSEE